VRGKGKIADSRLEVYEVNARPYSCQLNVQPIVRQGIHSLADWRTSGLADGRRVVDTNGHCRVLYIILAQPKLIYLKIENSPTILRNIT